MTEDVMLKFKAFCNEQSNCRACPIHLCYRIIDPNHPGKLLDICEKEFTEVTSEEEQIVLSIIEREEVKNART